MSRTLARETAFKALFQLEFNHGEEGERELYENLAIETAITESKAESGKRLNQKNLLYIDAAVKGTRLHLDEIDEMIKVNLKKGWTLSRVATADRNILRLAVYEMKFAEEKISSGIAINEAVELAKKYGTDDSSRFVNGILETISK